MSILSESQATATTTTTIATIMTSTSPQRKNRSKCKNKARNSMIGEQLPTNVLDEIHRVLEGRQSPIGCNDEDITGDCGRNDCVHDESLPHHKSWLDHSVKDLDLNSGKCLLCRCQHNPQKSSDANDSPQVSLWFCSDCKKIIEKEREANCSVTVKVTNTSDCSPLSTLSTLSPLNAFQSNLSNLSSLSTLSTTSSASIATQTTNSNSCSATTTTTTTTIQVTATSCSCAICKKHSDCGQTAHEQLRTCWHELKSAVLRIYRESGLVLNQTFMQQNRMDFTLHPKCPLPSNERLKEIVHKLCVHDRHKLYQCLEAQVRLFVVEMRLNLLKHLEHGSQALFEAMIDQYSKLCRASKKSAQFLQELESKHLRKFNLTWEFLNRRLFQSTVYCDTFIKHGLPKLTALTKDRSLIDMYARFLKFEDEMTVISVVWREAQQFIDKYEKYAILNKKRALLKEWEQLSVEWVLDDHTSNTGKANSGENPMCIKKPSIECLNARFIEEQKLLKSGKNMQSVNLVVETQSALQEQMLLAAYGEWDANDIKTIPNLSQTNKQLKSATASTQVDLLLTSKTKCDGKVTDDHDYDDCDEEEDDDDVEDDADDDDEDDEDSCSDQSSTSTSTSNNQREGGRVCDCCYCEVFGHGMPAVAPTSRNYNEMRERLRLRLSKRKAEKCEKNGTNSTSPETNIKSKENIELEDKRDLEELINFINGTDNNVKDKKKKEKQKKKKEKKIDLKDIKKEIKSEIKPLITSNSNSKTAETTKNHKIDKTNNDHHSKEINGSNHCHQNSLKSINNKEQQQKHDYTDESKDEIPALIDVDSHITSLSSNETTINNVTNGGITRSNNNNNNNFSNNNNNNNNNNKNGSNKKKIKTCNEKKFENHVITQNLAHVQNNSVNNHKANEEPVCNGVMQHSSYKANGNMSSQQIQQQLLSTLASPERLNSEMRHNNNKSKQNKVNKNKKKNNSDETLSPDEVFMPKDIDLDNGELDEFEKELEAFKRFCFNSKPLARKEKVNVNLKDIILKKRND